MFIGVLNVAEVKAAVLQPLHEINQADVRRVRDLIKHRFGQERSAKVGSEYAAHQLAVLPSLDRMRTSAIEQFDVELYLKLADPLGALSK